MKNKKTAIRWIAVAALALAPVAVAAAGKIANSPLWEKGAPADPFQREPLDARPNALMMERINAIGLGSGEISPLYEKKDAWGRPQCVYSNDLYEYVFDESGGFISLAMKMEKLSELPRGGKGLSEGEYIALAKKYLPLALPYFRLETTEITAKVDLENDTYAARVSLRDRQSDTLLNAGSMVFSKNGAPISIRGTSNNLELFNTAKISREDAKKIVFEALREYSEEIKKNGLPNADFPEKPLDPPGTFPDPTKEYDEHAGEEPFDQPKFEIYLTAANDLKFHRLEKEMIGGKVYWMAEAHTSTSWGKMDEILNFIYAFMIDAETGSIIKTETLSGG